MSSNKVFVNRNLNLRRIRYIGLDMDHTLIRYHSDQFELLSHTVIKDKLIKNKSYPETIRSLPFDYKIAIRGLVIDKKKGNLLKLNRHSAIRASLHGLLPIDHKTQQKLYKSTYIDLGDTNYVAIDTAFSVSLAVIFAQLVEMKKSEPGLFPDYAVIADDCINALDEAHRDGSLKNQVRDNLERYVIKDESIVAGLEKFKRHGKKIFVLTNSDYSYSKLLLDHAINPFLKDHKNWMELFEVSIVLAQKPRFFYDNLRFLRINPTDGSMTNVNEKIVHGLYQGGCAEIFTKDLGLEADEILYIGDHIYGDILRLKKDCGWRTAMVIEELEKEIETNHQTEPTVLEIERLMKKKEPLDDEFTGLMTQKIENRKDANVDRIDELQKQISDIDSQLAKIIRHQQSLYNERWGQLMRAGNEESYFAHQVDRFACVYMSKLSDLLANHSPRTNFRAPRRPLSHEVLDHTSHS